MKAITKPTKRMSQWKIRLEEAAMFIDNNRADDAKLIIQRVIAEMSGNDTR